MTAERMTALRIHEFGALPRLEAIACPRRAGEVLVKVLAAAITHLDLTVASGNFARTPSVPYVPGTQGVGVVVEGPSAGTRVRLSGQGLGVDRDGCWAEWISVPPAAMSPIPKTLDPAVAVALSTVAATAHVALHEVARVSSDDTLIVTGAGGAVGSVVAQLAIRAGVSRVLGIVSRAESAAALPAGVEPVVGRGDVLAAALARAGRGTVAVDTVGGDVLNVLLRAGIQPGGRVAIVGYTAGTGLELDLPSWLYNDVSLLPVNMLRRRGQSADLLSAADRLATSGDIAVPVQRVRLGDARAAVDRLRRGGVRGRLVLCPHENGTIR
ncbi:MAG TPA: zinc-binding dehydrogenase [Flexivirga sp.]|uniref:quinone oxidoreductase family protein n=1 Tax=Flexivirga sp. TaxID=1962927 RepID=UPI002CDFCEAC|nr:zinc-binding dehydrogenase [Flexivirga sp.]HWC23894.1 zinc-binding dehydrogenase [Flexivirga sp.]